MTDCLEWLKTTQGLAGLQSDEYEAIRDFTLLWGLFEGKAMATDGSPAEVVAAVDRMNLPKQAPASLANGLNYWRDRYWDADGSTAAFDGLRFRLNQYRTLVIEVLSGMYEDRENVLKALLLITLRLRNNLFHGVKWQYFLHDQLGNFANANAILMTAIDLAVPRPMNDGF